MRKRDAKKLHNGDQIEVCLPKKRWTTCMVIGDVIENSDGVFVNAVLEETNTYLSLFHHTEIR